MEHYFKSNQPKQGFGDVYICRPTHKSDTLRPVSKRDVMGSPTLDTFGIAEREAGTKLFYCSSYKGN